MSEQEFTPRDFLKHVLARAWLIVACGLAGGLIGWTFHFFHPPVYEATAVMTVNMNYPVRPLTQAEEDRSDQAAANLAVSSTVVKRVAEQAAAQGLNVSAAPYRLSLERKGSEWEFKVRDQQAGIAASLANLWVQTAYAALLETQPHALRAAQIQQELAAFQNCFPVVPQPTPTVGALTPLGCDRYALTEVQDSIRALGPELLAEQAASAGMLAGMEFTLTSPAVTPQAPILYDQARLVFAGAVIGILLSLWLVEISPFWKRNGKG